METRREGAPLRKATSGLRKGRVNRRGTAVHGHADHLFGLNSILDDLN
jgi:hypothetical protein